MHGDAWCGIVNFILSVYYACSDVFETSQLSQNILQNIATINAYGIWVCIRHNYMLLACSVFTYIGVGFALSVLLMFGQCEGLENVERQQSSPRFFVPRRKYLNHI